MVSWRLTDRVLDQGLPVDQERVLLRLARHANDQGGSCRPGITRLMDETGASERTVQRALLALQRGGYIRPVAYPRGGRGKVTEWQLCTTRWNPRNPVIHDTLLEGNPVTGGTVSGPKTPSPVTQNPVTGDTPIDQEKIRGYVPEVDYRIGRPEPLGPLRAGGAPGSSEKTISPEFVESLVNEYAAQLGGAAAVRQKIDDALYHRDPAKLVNPQQYLRRALQGARP